MKNIIYYISFYWLIALFINVIVVTVDAENWMSLVNGDKKINQINIPGTHDSGTYDITKLYNNKLISGVLSVLVSSIKDLSGQTQDLSITEQLKSGIRYLDIRLALNEDNKDLYVAHGILPCLYYDNTFKLYNYLYFEKVLEECVKFLQHHDKETIIIHLKRESINNDISDDYIGYLIGNSEHVKYFHFTNDADTKYTNKNMPTLEEVRGKIVFFMRSEFYYGKYLNSFNSINDAPIEESPVGFYRNIEDKGNCTVITNSDRFCKPQIENNFRSQDNYNLNEKNK